MARAVSWSQAGRVWNVAGGPGVKQAPRPRSINTHRHPSFAAEDSGAIQKAIDAAAAEAERTKTGVAVYLPAGTYQLQKRITISSSRVVLRGSGVRAGGGGCGGWG